MRRHFVIFYSPGTFIAEHTTKPIKSWDVKKAIELSKDIKERHGALPYGFQFITRERGAMDLDSKECDRSNMYYLGGEVLTIEDIEARNDPSERILLLNMRCNKWTRVVENNNSWKWTQPLNDGDIVLKVE